MERLKRDAVLLSLMDRLRHKGSWCGETHVQKATYFLQRLLGVPLGFKFILYKHGPYSFDLTEELNAMWADNLVKLEPQLPGYGPSYIHAEGAQTVLDLYPKSIEQYSPHLDFVTERLGSRTATNLEALSTALYVTLDEGNQGANRVARLRELKPHITSEAAQAAVEAIDHLIEAAGWSLLP